MGCVVVLCCIIVSIYVNTLFCHCTTVSLAWCQWHISSHMSYYEAPCCVCEDTCNYIWAMLWHQVSAAGTSLLKYEGCHGTMLWWLRHACSNTNPCYRVMPRFYALKEWAYFYIYETCHDHVPCSHTSHAMATCWQGTNMFTHEVCHGDMHGGGDMCSCMLYAVAQC